MLVSIDLSLRSTGVCILSNAGELVDFMLISPSTDNYKDEDLLNYISDAVAELLDAYVTRIDSVVIEGLSFNSFSGEKDKINGNFWHLRCILKENFPSFPVGIVPVTSWRSYTLTKEEQKKAKLKGKDGLKKACVDKLPSDVRDRFLMYIKNSKLKKDSIYDLTDAYHLGQYRLSLNKEN